jgi:hypothetical protein
MTRSSAVNIKKPQKVFHDVSSHILLRCSRALELRALDVKHTTYFR